MNLIEQYSYIQTPANADMWLRSLKLIEQCGRTAYLSEGAITDDSYAPFIRGIIKRGHESVLEHATMSVVFVTDRGISHELVRHRLASFTQESTRYCDYSADKFGKNIEFIKPSDFDTWDSETKSIFLAALEEAENAYLALRAKGIASEFARAVLPNALRTRIAITANMREWRTIFKLRAFATKTNRPHPQMLQLMRALYDECRNAAPCVFDDLGSQIDDEVNNVQLH